MKRKRNTTKIEMLLKDRETLLDKRKENLDVISEHTQEVSKLTQTKSIAEKIDKGEHISDEENKKFQDIKEQYESFFEEENDTKKENLEEAISYVTGEKELYINKDLKLKEDIKVLDNKMKNNAYLEDDVPDKPDKSNESGKPDKSNEPDKADESGKPDKSNEPDKADEPDKSDKSNEPEKSNEPYEPDTSTDMPGFMDDF